MVWPFSSSSSTSKDTTGIDGDGNDGAAAADSHQGHVHSHQNYTTEAHHSHNHNNHAPATTTGVHSHSHNHSTMETETRSLLSTSNKERPPPNPVMRRLQTASILCVCFLLVEVVGGWLAGSLAVMSDAAHLFADLASFAVAIAASHLGSLPSTDQHTFGLKRVESLAALFSMVSLALVSVALFVEAIRRLLQPEPEPVDGPLMSGIAAIGVLVNVVLAFVLGEHHVHMPGAGHHHDHSHDHDDDGHENHHDHSHGHHHDANHDEEECEEEEDHGYGAMLAHDHELPPPALQKKKPQQRNINLHAAYLHVLGDLAQSVAVLLAGLIIWVRPNWHVVDPICTLLFCSLVFYSTLGVLRSSISVLLEEVPPHLSWIDIHEEIEAVEGIVDVHDLHIWSISHGIPTLSVHCIGAAGEDSQQLLRQVYNVCKKYGIVHATIQIQCEGDDCITCSEMPIGGQKCTESSKKTSIV